MEKKPRTTKRASSDQTGRAKKRLVKLHTKLSLQCLSVAADRLAVSRQSGTGTLTLGTAQESASLASASLLENNEALTTCVHSNFASKQVLEDPMPFSAV